MQRLLAALVLLVTGFLPAGSTWIDAINRASVPACCRLDGKHHCAMRSASAAKEFRSIADRCTQSFPISSTAVSISADAVPAFQLLARATVPGLIAALQSQSLFCVAFDRNWQKRGPPTLFS